MVGLALVQGLRLTGCLVQGWHCVSDLDQGQDGPCAQLSRLWDGAKFPFECWKPWKALALSPHTAGAAAAAGLQFLRSSAGDSVDWAKAYCGSRGWQNASCFCPCPAGVLGSSCDPRTCVAMDRWMARGWRLGLGWGVGEFGMGGSSWGGALKCRRFS